MHSSLDGIVLNPGPREYYVSREFAAELLERAALLPLTDKDADEQEAEFFCFRQEPRGVIDARAILREWNSDWLESEDEAPQGNDWVFCFCPVMPDGSALVTFAREKKQTVEYRVLQYVLDPNEGAVLKTKYKFSIGNCELVTVFCNDDALWMLAVTPGGNYDLLQLVPTDYEKYIKLGKGVCDCCLLSGGLLAVTYSPGTDGHDGAPVKLFNLDDKSTITVTDDSCPENRTLSVLPDGKTLAYTTFPGYAGFYEPGSETQPLGVMFDLQGFDTFGISDKREVGMVSYDMAPGQGKTYVLFEYNHRYSRPIEFAFEPRNAAGKLITRTECESFGNACINAGQMLIRADDRLYWYKLSDFEGTKPWDYNYYCG